MSILLALTAGILAIPALGFLIQLVGSGLDRLRYPPPGRMIQVGGHKLHLTESGTREASTTVVFEAGIGASSLSWCYIKPELEPYARIITYDRAGLGWSEAHTTPRTAKQVVHELIGLLDNAGIREPVLLVGHSFGGMTSLTAASLHPERFKGLVLVDPLHPAEWALPDSQRKTMLHYGWRLCERGASLARFGVVRSALRILMLGSRGTAQAVNRASAGQGSGAIERLVGEVRKMPRELWPVVRAHWSQPKNFLSLGGFLKDLPLSSAQAANALRPLDVPLIVLSASNLEPPRMDAHRALAGLSPRGQHIIASRGGHWIHLDEPELVVKAVRSLLKTV